MQYKFPKSPRQVSLFLDTGGSSFKAICIPKTWCSGDHDNNYLYKSSNYNSLNSIHQTRIFGKTGGNLAIFVHNSVTFSVRKDLRTNNKDIGELFMEIINANSKNILGNTSYRQPAGR